MKKAAPLFLALSSACAANAATLTHQSPDDRTGVAAQTLRSVVKIVVDGRGHGTGFFCYKSGFVCTAAHVVQDLEGLEVKRQDGSKCRVEHVRIHKEHDVAVLRTNCTTLPSHRLSGNAKPHAGRAVMAAGHPKMTEYAVSFGYVMNEKNVLGGHEMFMFSAPVNPGNSGGPIVDMHGHLVGVVSAMYTTSGMWAGMGFGVRSEFLEELVK